MTKKELWRTSIRYKEREGHISSKCEFCNRKLNNGDDYLVILKNYSNDDGYCCFDIKYSYVICKNCFLKGEKDD